MIDSEKRITTNASPMSRLLTDPFLLVYNALIILRLPWFLREKKSQWSGRRDKYAERFAKQRWTIPLYKGAKLLESTSAEPGPHIVFLAFGYGQVRQLSQLSAALKKERPDVQITWALTKPVAVARVCEKYPDQEITLIPFDFILPTVRWLRRTSPDVIVMVERAWYPNIVRCGVDWGAELVLINGVRQTYNSSANLMPTWMRRWVAAGFSILCFQQEDYYREAQDSIPSKVDVRIVGNIKFDSRPENDPVKQNELSQWLEDSERKPIFAAGSTGEADEEYVLRAFNAVRQKSPCRLLVAPRQLSRVDEIAAVMTAEGLVVSRRTQPVPNADVFLVDTFGELALAYQFCAAAFIGGTVRGAGHDVVEPLVWGVPVFFGPGGGKIGPGHQETESAGVGFRVHSPEELAERWLQLIQNETIREDLRDKSRQLLEEQSGALSRNVAAITELIETED